MYSLGYRVNLASLSIVATGGIYVHALPVNASVTIDGGIQDNTGLFSNAFFVQNLVPGPHTVSVSKDGYFTYEKTVPVSESQVTKLENIVLFKSEPAFSLLSSTANSMSGSPDGSKIVFATITEKNITLTIHTINGEQAKTVIIPVAKAIISQSLWSPNSQTLTLQIGSKYYSVDVSAEKPVATLLAKAPAELNTLKTNLSPSGDKIITYDTKGISYIINDSVGKVIPLQSGIAITNAAWINNDYIIYTTANGIFITETDPIGNINVVQLPTTILPLDGASITITSPTIYFNSQDKKLYLLTGKTLLVSERLIP